MPASNGMPADQLAGELAKEQVEQSERELCRGRGAPGRRDCLAQLASPVRPCPGLHRAEISAFVAGVKDGEFDDLT